MVGQWTTSKNLIIHCYKKMMKYEGALHIILLSCMMPSVPTVLTHQRAVYAEVDTAV